MSLLKHNLALRPWPFRKDEVVELFWICSPYLDRDKGWLMKVAFKRMNNEIKEITVPWGTIPCLIIGQLYSNGLPSSAGNKGMVSEITIPERSVFDICIAYDIPKTLYYFYKNQNYGFQKICRFSIGDRHFYIPCLEIVRTYLTPHKILANCIMKPGGLDILIEKTDVKGRDLYINFTDEVPRRIVCDETAAYIAWLKYDLYANKAWNSIYNKVFSKAIQKSPYSATSELYKSTYIEVLPPIGKGSKWSFRGITVGKDTLILELLSRTNLYMSFENIYYSHPSLTSPQTSSENKTVRVVKTNSNNSDTVNLDKTCEASKKDMNQSVVEHISIGFSFNKNPKMKKVRIKNQKHRLGEADNAILTRYFEELEGGEETATTQDWIYGGQIQPIEFKSLEIVRGGAVKGLEDFLKVVDYIDKKHKEYKLSLNLVYIPKGKSFSTYPDGTRRNCAIVKLERKNKLPCYVLEVGRADGWSISTLIMYQLVTRISLEDVEEMMSKLLNELISNNGHWDKQSISRNIYFRFDIMKHISGQREYRCGERLITKLF